ncbi:MAG: spore coat U domain-containing protein [Sodalis sp. (in: enterobacteria)]|uniref:Csu type fimbrial protein n=1 Tax=Sodalis sp. (in: enterobacteria) TaxID=1898979 RepID=UPI0039E4FAE9
MTKTLLAVGCLAGVFCCYSARAAEAAGTINATLTLTNGCLINDDPATTNANFGNLDFGTHAATFDTLEATMSGAIGDGIRVRCSDGAASYIVQITGSSNPAPSNTPYGTVTANAHNMTLTTDPTQAVAYTLYNDAGFTSAIANGTNLTAASNSDPVNGEIYPIYGRITGGGNSTNIPAGTYADVINVQITY